MRKMITLILFVALFSVVGNSYAEIQTMTKEEMQKQTEIGEEMKNRKLYYTYESTYTPTSKDSVFLSKIDSKISAINKKSPAKLRKIYQIIDGKLLDLAKKYRNSKGEGVTRKGTRMYYLLEQVNNRIAELEGNQDLGCAKNSARTHMKNGVCENLFDIEEANTQEDTQTEENNEETNDEAVEETTEEVAEEESTSESDTDNSSVREFTLEGIEYKIGKVEVMNTIGTMEPYADTFLLIEYSYKDIDSQYGMPGNILLQYGEYVSGSNSRTTQGLQILTYHYKGNSAVGASKTETSDSFVGFDIQDDNLDGFNVIIKAWGAQSEMRTIPLSDLLSK